MINIKFANVSAQNAVLEMMKFSHLLFGESKKTYDASLSGQDVETSSPANGIVDSIASVEPFVANSDNSILFQYRQSLMILENAKWILTERAKSNKDSKSESYAIPLSLMTELIPILVESKSRSDKKDKLKKDFSKKVGSKFEFSFAVPSDAGISPKKGQVWKLLDVSDDKSLLIQYTLTGDKVYISSELLYSSAFEIVK